MAEGDETSGPPTTPAELSQTNNTTNLFDRQSQSNAAPPQTNALPFQQSPPQSNFNFSQPPQMFSFPPPNTQNNLFQPPEVNFVAKIPMPRLVQNDIESWFMSLDFWFPASGVVNDSKKYNTVLAAIEPSLLPQLRGIISGAPEHNKYEYIRTQLINFFAESQQRKLNRLLMEMPLGDMKPSQLFYEMQRVAGTSVSDEAVLNLWARRLPDHARAAVVASTATMEERTKIADAIVDVLQQNQINSAAVAATSPSNKIQPEQQQVNQIEQMRAEIQRLSRNFEEMMSHQSRKKQRERSSSRNSQRSGTPTECWFHRKFGQNARKCRAPCRFNTTSVEPNKSE